MSTPQNRIPPPIQQDVTRITPPRKDDKDTSSFMRNLFTNVFEKMLPPDVVTFLARQVVGMDDYKMDPEEKERLTRQKIASKIPLERPEGIGRFEQFLPSNVKKMEDVRENEVDRLFDLKESGKEVLSPRELNLFERYLPHDVLNELKERTLSSTVGTLLVDPEVGPLSMIEGHGLAKGVGAIRWKLNRNPRITISTSEGKTRLVDLRNLEDIPDNLTEPFNVVMDDVQDAAEKGTSVIDAILNNPDQSKLIFPRYGPNIAASVRSMGLGTPKWQKQFDQDIKNLLGDFSDPDDPLQWIPVQQTDIIDELKTGEGTIGAGFDQSLLKKLGANLYKGSVPSIAVKEVIQNSVDSVRGLGGGGKIDVKLDINNRLINISDNGTGMSPATVTKEFMDVGGSLKSEGSSGGYGLAKVGIFSQADRISVETVALVDGKKIYTTVKGSGDDWINGKLKINSYEADDAVPTGTRMELKLNEEVAGISDNWYEASNFLREFEGHNLLEGTQVNITGHNMYGIEAKNVVDAYGDKIDTIELPNATVDVYASKSSDKTGWVTPRILNKGLYQFNQTPIHLESESPRSLIFDVKSKVDVDNPAYPFTTSREELKGDVAKGVSDYMKKLSHKMASKRINRLRDIMTKPTPIKDSSGGSSIYRLTEDTPQSFADLVASSKYMAPLNDAANLITQDILLAIRGIKRYSHIPNVNFGGVSLDPGHLGVNIRTKVLNDLEAAKDLPPLMPFGSDDNVILFNPYSILREVRAEYFGSIGVGKFSANRAAEQTWETLVHEVIHQLASGHTEEFAGTFTRILHAVRPNGEDHIKELKGIYDFASKNDMGIHAADIITFWGNNAKQETLFKGLTGH